MKSSQVVIVVIALASRKHLNAVESTFLPNRTNLVSTIALSLISAFGGLLGFYTPRYIAKGKSYGSITPTQGLGARGVGNLLGMPIAIALGRRVVILVAALVLMIGAILCATGSSFEMHLVARVLLGFAAGQGESVVPMIIQVGGDLDVFGAY
ncbi:uncharacterized protein A1O9_11671 [Exophiala aquamarina CBS 119918]|uniref:Major facilitator superfamily (MFS) profile domain-containing protein n=1 Tax=Exophiala aquamarina CBS 119918 TaxID=1182545 RepID=A0A072PA39_9EURO|nr:uncharacterized protein A1O9_11671 [Exophiala aquamarina CBS 119918]KEF52430.1 hypothetical protein A1O9_11671 [Exophiala aquamarina CBS 119918]